MTPTCPRILQRVAGYCASGATSEDILPYFFGSGSNGKRSFAGTLMAALGDYALVFAPKVMMEARGERHHTELAQFMGVRLALCSEPSSAATWNDSRVKALTETPTFLRDSCVATTSYVPPITQDDRHPQPHAQAERSHAGDAAPYADGALQRRLPFRTRAGARPPSNALLSRYLMESGFSRKKPKLGRSFIGLRIVKR